MRLITVWVEDDEPKIGLTVLGVHPTTGDLLVGSNSDDTLRWVPVSKCHVSQVHRTAEEEQWWQRLTREHGNGEH